MVAFRSDLGGLRGLVGCVPRRGRGSGVSLRCYDARGVDSGIDVGAIFNARRTSRRTLPRPAAVSARRAGRTLSAMWVRPGSRSCLRLSSIRLGEGRVRPGLKDLQNN
eukprot:4574286-Prymnesium_polylepis.1